MTAQIAAQPSATMATPPAVAEGELPVGARTVARTLRRSSLPPAAVSGVALLLDAAALGLGLWFAADLSGRGDDAPARAALLAVLGALGGTFALWAWGLYRLRVLRRFWSGAAPLLALGVALAALDGHGWWALAPVLPLLPARGLGALLAATALDYGLTERRAIILGGGDRAERVITTLAESPDNDIRVCGMFDDRDDLRSPPVVAGVPKLGRLEVLLPFARSAEIDLLIVTIPLSAEQRIRQILKLVEVLPVDVRLSDFSADPTFRRRGPFEGLGASGGLVSVMSRPIRGGKLAAKRAMDLLGAAVALLLLSPVLLLTALAVRLESPGPIFFRQLRYGYNQRPVLMWKFRSLRAESCDPLARRVVTRGDPRVTRVGRVIRRWSIDELPQLFNVLAGELSLVGPRPHVPGAVSSRQESFEAIVDGYAARHKVRPGITGWAQINGWRGEIDDPESLRRRVEHDLYYIENWSIWFDLYVLLLTPLRLLGGKGAY
ncbi:exopolysaccharide biosynthesis polyprenyl glycosylphosphotransferase [Rubellimicrobium aerolatum]|uniref:Exopolysaccharide biosynthesis polyprenyl glycosylphosphotransferase n=1 Tax=Rubellimicrobium aerolatum TaxID=490979 RepID=A0ABW0SGL9_9RHOB|nr:exopolysaccharide biosynthesis polyprenyl glycosylphosphotransferase [Rubellimicrobium aerolatum]MBP1807418.1 Undecaprenyl-phosphate glucose phosphotransferase [Rubellimicrobium aerolatum]